MKNMEIVEKIREQTKSIDGWLSSAEGELLYSLAKKASPQGVIVEIGSWKGKSTVWLAHGSLAGQKIAVYAIDPHTGSKEHQKSGPVATFEEFKNNISSANIDHMVKPLMLTSAEAANNWDQPISLLWIDGSHEYDDVLQDYKLWSPFLLPESFIAFHDTITWSGPRTVVQEHLLRSSQYSNVKIVDNITYAKKAPAKWYEIFNKTFLIFRVNAYVRYRWLRRKCINFLVACKRIAKRLASIFFS